MPWKECSVMEERLRFVVRLLDGEAMTDVCREFGISRKTGYKIFDRYKEHGLEALTDRCRRPIRYANQLPPQIESLILTVKREKPHWGARKIREVLVRRLDGDIRVPAKSTIHAVLHRHKLVKALRRARHRATGTPLSTGIAPNELGCADYKGEFKLGNGQYCYPLTVTDHASRFLLLCEALESTREDLAVTALHRKKINISTVLAGQRLGIKEVDDGIWVVSFLSYDLGFIDLEQRTLQPLDNPFGPRLLPMSYDSLPISPVRTLKYLERAKGFEPSTPTLAR
jgi:transposase